LYIFDTINDSDFHINNYLCKKSMYIGTTAQQIISSICCETTILYNIYHMSQSLLVLY
jgi:hypothetical protein